MKNRKKSKSLAIPKMTMISLLVVSLILLIFLVVWLVGELRGTFGPPINTGDNPGLHTTSGNSSNLGSSEQNEVITLVDKYINELLETKHITLKYDNISVEINAAEANAPVDFQELESYLTKNGLDSGLVGQYRTILEANNQPEDAMNEDYILEKISELNGFVKTGYDSYFEIGEDSVIITRGKQYLFIDESTILSQIKNAFKSKKYETITAISNMETPDPPNWDDLWTEVFREPENAKYEIDESEKTVFVEHIPGRTIDIELIKEEYQSEIWDKRSYPLIITLPEITSENIEESLFDFALSSVTTYYNVYETSRSTNVALSAKAINDYVVLPGNKFSFNNVVGRRTLEKGYKDASIFIDGRVEPGLGGGICQVSSTMYKAAQLANMRQFTRYHHDFTVGYIEMGMDATVYWGVLDYIFINNTDYPIKIVTSTINGALNIKIMGTKYYDTLKVQYRHEIIETIPPETIEELDTTLSPGESVPKTKGRPGYKVETYKKVTLDGVAQPEIKITTDNYKPYNSVNRVGPPLEESTTSDTTTTTTPAPTTTTSPATTTTTPTTTTVPSTPTTTPTTTSAAVTTTSPTTTSAPTTTTTPVTTTNATTTDAESTVATASTPSAPETSIAALD